MIGFWWIQISNILCLTGSRQKCSWSHCFDKRRGLVFMRYEGFIQFMIAHAGFGAPRVMYVWLDTKEQWSTYVYFCHQYELLVGWGKKYDYSLRKNAKVRGIGGNVHCTWGKKGFLACYWGKNTNFRISKRISYIVKNICTFKLVVCVFYLIFKLKYLILAGSELML